MKKIEYTNPKFRNPENKLNEVIETINIILEKVEEIGKHLEELSIKLCQLTIVHFVV